MSPAKQPVSRDGMFRWDGGRWVPTCEPLPSVHAGLAPGRRAQQAPA